MVEFFLKQLEAEEVLNAWLNSKQKGHAILLLGDKFKCQAAAEFVLARLEGQDVKIREKTHPDIDFLQDDEKPITIDMIREIKLSAGRKACLLPQRICIVEQASRMNVQAQNALLKLLEEPPPGMLFIFTDQSVNGFLNTVISRVIKINLRPILPDECERMLTNQFGVEKTKARELVEVFDGDLSEAVECAGVEANQKLFKLAKEASGSVQAKDFYKTAVALSKAEDKESFARLIKYTRFLLLSNGKPGCQCMVEILSEAKKRLDSNTNLGLTQSWIVAMLLLNCAKES